MPYERELDAVLRWFERTDQIALSSFAVDVPYRTKDDGTPVTDADQRIEQTVRAAIDDVFSGDAVLGEEEGDTGEASRRWIVDPIDGTKNFMRGVPVFATLIALEQDGELVLGAVSAPALRARWWAVHGGGAFRDGNPIRVSSVDRLEQVHFTAGSLSGGASEVWRAYARLADSTARGRAFGDFWGHMLVAQGSVDVMIEFADLAPWDVAAPKVIVEEAGGRFTDPLGRDAREGAVLSTNGIVHDDVVALLAG